MGQLLSCGDQSSDPLLKAKQLELEKTTQRADKAKREAAILYLQTQQLKTKVLEFQKSPQNQSSKKEKTATPVVALSEKTDTIPAGTEESKKKTISSPPRISTPVRRGSSIRASEKSQFSGISYNVKEYNYFDEVGFN